jgi:vancomycin permeability regulator SanA
MMNLNLATWKLKLDKYKKPLLYISLAVLVLLGSVFGLTNYHVEQAGEKYIFSADQVPDAEVVLVLGAYVLPNGNVSTMLNDRLMVGYELYKNGKAPRILVSGDHGQTNYDEVNTMKSFLKAKGVPSQDIFMDHAGFSTYESMYRARDIFQVKKVIIVTQHYHLKRAVFIARELGVEAYGVASDLHNYGPVMAQYQLREMAARNKDFWLAKIIKPQPTFLGDAIPVFGDGRATDDK